MIEYINEILFLKNRKYSLYLFRAIGITKMKETSINTNKKEPSFRLRDCGKFPDHKLNKTLKEKNILYLISVGTPKFEDKWVERLINFTKKIKPQKVRIIVADSLQRFNIELEENLTEAAALEESEKRGKQWRKKYEPYFSTLDIVHEFISWEDQKKDEDYQKYFNEIIERNESNKFNESLTESAKVYVDRRFSYKFKDPEFKDLEFKDRAFQQSIKFLNEECAVIRVLAKDTDNIGIFYPSKPLAIFTHIIDNFVNKSRPSEHPFFYAELVPTKKKGKGKKEENRSIFFQRYKKLSIEDNENQNIPSASH